MSRIISFTADGWQDYLYWQKTDKQVLKRINQLLKDCQRSPHEGIGKPEPLRHELTGAWSRRITDEHRLVYVVTGQDIRVAACRYHY
ncbi:Txe/YoeB family addiction module toxin [Candidatus Saccharibacteria bacterium]|nr:Txe/YoeB family addiction module toxin [Candidatus Saccharibacteria bacterium]HPG37532.1 Txe/YoeB family addiction module toxin [Candidatus Saccharibacteria bacterium]